MGVAFSLLGQLDLREKVVTGDALYAVHWARDVVFGEDQSQVRTGSAPQLLAALRNLVMGLLRLIGVKNIAAALRHYGWKPWETLTLIGLSPDN